MLKRLFSEYAAAFFLQISIGMVLPMLFVIFLAVSHPISLPKQMYLCPMSRGERKKYIVHLYYFRIILHMTVCVAGIVIMIPFTRHNVIAYIQILLNDFILSILTESYNQNKSENEKRQVYKIVIILVLVGLNFIQLIVLSDMESAHTMITAAEGIIFILAELPVLYFCCKDMKKQIEAAVFYEKGI